MTKLIDVIHELNPDSKNYQVIALQDLQAELVTSKGAKIVSLIMATYPELNRNVNIPCPFDYDILKVSYINGIINFDYAAAVNKQRVREGKEPDFIPKPRNWGVHIPDSPFISHVLKKTGEHKLYLEVKIERAIDHIFYSITQKKIFEDNIVRPFLKLSSDAQDLEKGIVYRTPEVKNIITMTFDKQGYFIKENL
jgi:hypothetical protein